MRGAFKVLLVAAAVAAVSAPRAARADGFFSPWVSAQGGNGQNLQNSRPGVGIYAGGMGAGIIGGEVGFGYSPSFWGTANDFGNNSVIDLMGNVIVGIPIGGTHGGGVRPFAAAGLGLLRTQIDGGTLATVSSSKNMLGWNLGGGVMGYFNDHVGLRGDLRYLRSFENPDTGVTAIDLGTGQVHFWRASIGLVLR